MRASKSPSTTRELLHAGCDYRSCDIVLMLAVNQHLALPGREPAVIMEPTLAKHEAKPGVCLRNRDTHTHTDRQRQRDRETERERERIKIEKDRQL